MAVIGQPARCYPVIMTTVEIEFRYAAPPAEQVAMALASARDVYGIRRLSLDQGARTLRIEYDATRLNAAAVTKLVREAGLELAEAPPQIAASTPQPSTPAA
ncbi:MAG: hypothetical protein ABSD70_01285 [Terracidiphilus sp.]|jgi:hypothetical protein